MTKKKQEKVTIKNSLLKTDYEINREIMELKVKKLKTSVQESEITIRERAIAIRERELSIKEKEERMKLYGKINSKLNLFAQAAQVVINSGNQRTSILEEAFNETCNQL